MLKKTYIRHTHANRLVLIVSLTEAMRARVLECWKSENAAMRDVRVGEFADLEAAAGAYRSHYLMDWVPYPDYWDKFSTEPLPPRRDVVERSLRGFYRDIFKNEVSALFHEGWPRFFAADFYNDYGLFRSLFDYTIWDLNWDFAKEGFAQRKI